MTTLEQRIERVTKGEWRDWKKEYALPKPDGSFVDEGELYWWAGEMEAIIEALQQRVKEREQKVQDVLRQNNNLRQVLKGKQKHLNHLLCKKRDAAEHKE